MPGLVGRTLAELAAFGIGALALGSLVLRRLGGGNAPLRLLVGLGATGYLTILLSLAHALRWWTLVLVAAAAIVAARRDLRPPRLPRGDRLTLALAALATAMACGQLLAALAPPEAYDELAYHLPYADAIRQDAAQQLFHASGPYADLVAGIRSFGPRTAGGFVELPWRVASDASLVPFLALSLVAVALLAPRARAVAAYAALYVTNWYWIATHQIRFLLSGVAAAILAVTIAVASGGRTLRIVLACMAVAAVALTQARVHPFSVSGIDDAVAGRFGSPKALYALGLESREAYLKRYLGCTADAVAYLDRHPELAPTLVPQTALAPDVGRRARFGKLPLESRTPAAALRGARRSGFRSVFLLGAGPWNLATTDRSSGALLGRASPVWRKGDCSILLLRLPH